jgi:hypothetical protein
VRESCAGRRLKHREGIGLALQPMLLDYANVSNDKAGRP